MPVRQEDYHGLIIRAGAFQVGHDGRFLPTLSIERAAANQSPSATALLDPPCPHELFETADEVEIELRDGERTVRGNGTDIAYDGTAPRPSAVDGQVEMANRVQVADRNPKFSGERRRPFGCCDGCELEARFYARREGAHEVLRGGAGAQPQAHAGLHIFESGFGRGTLLIVDRHVVRHGSTIEATYPRVQRIVFEICESFATAAKSPAIWLSQRFLDGGRVWVQM